MDYVSRMYYSAGDGSPDVHTPKMTGSDFQFVNAELYEILDWCECDKRADIIAKRAARLTAYDTMLSKQGLMYTQYYFCRNWPYGPTGRDAAMRFSAKIADCTTAVADDDTKARAMWNRHIDALVWLDHIEVRGNSIASKLSIRRSYYEWLGYGIFLLIPQPTWPY